MLTPEEIRAMEVADDFRRDRYGYRDANGGDHL